MNYAAREITSLLFVGTISIIDQYKTLGQIS
jgi:hypothetical protein